MDYCHPCRRHLNGALACPGCGTPARELRSSDDALTASEVFDRRYGVEPTTADDTPREAPGRKLDDAPDGTAGENADGPTHEPLDDATPPGDRSSRRDRKAAAHRRRRRRTLLVAAGFVLAAGGLSLAELGMDAPHSAEEPAAAAGETTDGEATREVAESSAIPADDTSDRTTPSGTPSPDASASASASGSPSSSPETTKSQTATEPDSPSASRPPSPDPTGPADPDPSPPETSDDPPPTTTPAPPESPDPTPTETCDRFLWWCT
ncbi:SCO2400 family protein [Streptomyces sp. enrichment culture]|uniref:SCO2400 family protein n=1 Tax=Streptomyces sp. enrichment culture TaxID=1795815 RepID=UPI003F550B62